MKVALIFGGRSPESDISVITALTAAAALSETGYEVTPVYMYGGDFYTGGLGKVEEFTPFRPERHKKVLLYKGSFFELRRDRLRGKWRPDVALVCCHGGEGEDGTLSALLEYNGVPYCSTGIAGSAIGMDKELSKRFFRSMLLNVVPYAVVTKGEFESGGAAEKIRAAKLRYPLIVKPVSQGSSIGICTAGTEEELPAALAAALAYGDRAIVEEKLSDFTEVNCAAFARGGEIVVSETEQPLSAGDVLTFEDKYLGGEKGAGGRVPADIGELSAVIGDMTRRIYLALGLTGVVRADFLVDERRGKVYINEINTVPGSLAFYLFEPLGISAPELLTSLIKEGAAKGDRRTGAAVFPSPVLTHYSASARGAKAARRGAKG